MDALLSAAAQPGTEEELAGMSAFVQVFTAEVTASTLTFRSHSMFAGRITRRATAMIAITLLAAGGAAAAAAGVDLPNPFSSDSTAEVRPNSDTTDDNSIVDTTDVDSSDLISLDSVSPELHDLCEAWAKDANQDASDPAFADLAAAAEQDGLSIDDYCAAVSNDDDDSSDDNGTDDSSDDDSSDDDNSTDNSIDDKSTDNSTDNSIDDNSGSNSGGSNSGGGNSGSDKTDAPTTAKPVKGESNG